MYIDLYPSEIQHIQNTVNLDGAGFVYCDYDRDGRLVGIEVLKVAATIKINPSSRRERHTGVGEEMTG